MFRTLHWELELGNSRVLSSGHWLWLRAILWSPALFGSAVVLFLVTLSLRRWLHLPEWTDYPIAILVPVTGLMAYALAVRIGEKRYASEVRLSKSTAYELLAGFGIGFATVSATERLTGGSLGPDGSILAAIVGLIVIAGILYANSRNAFRRRDATAEA